MFARAVRPRNGRSTGEKATHRLFFRTTRSCVGSVCTLALLVAGAGGASAITLRQAIEQTIENHPAIEAARENRRATEREMLQAAGRTLPLVDLSADIGPEKVDKPGGLAPDVNDRWRARRQAAVTLRQYIFDGFDRANDIYKNAARVDAAALRVLSRSEALGLDAAEAYIDIGRHQDVLAITQRNIKRQRDLLRLVQDLERGGKATRSEVLQMEERVTGAEVSNERVRESLLEAEAKFRRVVGVKPTAIGRPGLPPKLPTSSKEAVAIGLGSDPNIAAAAADADAAKAAFKQTESALYPNLALELRGQAGADIAGTPGRDNEVAGRVVLSWNLFDGMISRNKRQEFAHRWQQAMAERDDRARITTEQIERAIANYQVGTSRQSALRSRLTTAQKVSAAFEEEFKAAKRSLIEVLDAEATKFNAEIDLVSGEAVRVFSGYRLLAAMGKLLATLGVSAPTEGYAEKRQWVKDAPRSEVHLAPLRR